MNSDNVLKNSEILLKRLAVMSEEELSELIAYHNKKYFEDADPEITDEAFDKLVEVLRFRNPESQVLEEIGAKTSGDYGSSFGNQVIHEKPMLSLLKCYDESSFFKWCEKIRGDLVAMPKIDGVACSISYSKEGVMLRAATRGDGRVGEDITTNARLISDLPTRLLRGVVEEIIDSDTLEVRGEVFLPLSQFKLRFSTEFVSPRNLAAGFLKLKEGDRKRNSFLKFFPYDLRGSIAVREQEKFKMLKELGFSMMPWSLVKNDQQALLPVRSFLKNRDSFDFEIDGVVFRADDDTEHARLGETAHHPRFAMAFKFQGESAQTKLIAVEWSVARSGIITPIAVVEPVFVSGASVARASLHNFSIFTSLDLRENSLVEIVRRGGVIPYLESVLNRSGDAILPPTSCPSCGGAVVVDGDFLRCQNPDRCEEVLVSKLVHFCHVLDIDGMGEKIVRKLFRAGLLSNFGDVFRLSAEKIMPLERMGEVLAKKLVAEIDNKRTIDLATFIVALGIYEVGNNVADLITASFDSLSKIRKLKVEDLLPIHGIGQSIAQSLIDGLREHAAEIDDLLTEVEVIGIDHDGGDIDHLNPLFKKSVVFTGKMAHLERKAAQLEVKRLGGRTPGAMSAHVDFLVVGDEGSPLLGAGKKSTKQRDAEKLIRDGYPIRIISEREFLDMLDENG